MRCILHSARSCYLRNIEIVSKKRNIIQLRVSGMEVRARETPTGSVFPLVGSSTALAIVLGEGPVEAAKYRDEKAGYEAYVIRQYLEPKLVQDTAIDKICT